MFSFLKNLSAFLGSLIVKFLEVLPRGSFTYQDLIEGADKFNDSHILNYINWFLPINSIVTLINIWIVGILGTVAGLLLYKFALMKFGGK